MRIVIALLLICCIYTPIISQNSIESVLKKYNKNSVPYISVKELSSSTQSYTLLDTREKEEYDVSKLKNATFAGYTKFNLDTIKNNYPDKNTPIVVYCSIGVRSEKIGEKLLKAGYTHVKNLYGGIFEWKAKGNTVFDSQNKETEKVHAYSKYWGKLLTNDAEKIYSAKL